MSGCGHGEDDEGDLELASMDAGAASAAEYRELYGVGPTRGLRTGWEATARDRHRRALADAGLDADAVAECLVAWDSGFYGEEDV